MSFYRSEVRTSAKQRVCEGCWWKTKTNPIKPGDKYASVACMSEGEFFTYALCMACHDFLESPEGKEWLREGDGWSAGDVLAARTHEAYHISIYS